jgi:hypothetical protein
MNAVAQSFAGVKTFTGGVVMNKATTGYGDSPLTIDCQSQTNMLGLYIANPGSGVTGIVIGGIALFNTGQNGTQGGLALGVTSTNAVQSFFVNNDAYAPTATAAFHFSSDGGNRPANAIMAIRGGATQSAPLLSLRNSGNTELANFSAAGILNGPTAALTNSLTVSSGLGASAADVVARIGSTLAPASINNAAALFAVSTGIGGTVADVFKVRKGDSFAAPIAINYGSASNQVGIDLSGGGPGWGGLHWNPAGGGRVVFGSYSSTISGVCCENRGLYFEQNANSYDANALMRWMVDTAATVAASVPVFDFRAPSNIQAGQLLARWQVNSVDTVTMSSRGTLGLGAAAIPDASGTPGAATQNTPRGRAAIASGVAAVTITNDQVDTNSVVYVEFEADPGANHWVTVAAGTFTVTLAAAPGTAKTFRYIVFK